MAAPMTAVLPRWMVATLLAVTIMLLTDRRLRQSPPPPDSPAPFPHISAPRLAAGRVVRLGGGSTGVEGGAAECKDSPRGLLSSPSRPVTPGALDALAAAGQTSKHIP